MSRECTEEVEVAVVGGGPAGLSAAVELRRRGIAPVVVIEREPDAGGVPRHADHLGFGVRDLRRVMSGPAYARRLVEDAERHGVELRLRSQVTAWGTDGDSGAFDDPVLQITSPRGRIAMRARAVVLATGCRERPRSARLVPGSRPQGVMTTGTLQQIVHLAGDRVGRRAVVVGAEHVSFSAVETLARGGAVTVALTTEASRGQSFAAFELGARVRYGVEVRTRTRVAAIHGRPRVQSVDLLDLDTGVTETVECDTVVFTADWVPDHELSALGGLAIDPGTRGPAVDARLRTDRPGVFAVGNLLHGAEPADAAALTGRAVAQTVLAHLQGEEWPDRRVPICCEEPLRWVVPNVVSARSVGAGTTSVGMAVRAREELLAPRLEIAQAGRVLAVLRVRRVMAGRSVQLSQEWVNRVDPDDGPVVVRVRSGRPRR